MPSAISLPAWCVVVVLGWKLRIVQDELPAGYLSGALRALQRHQFDEAEVLLHRYADVRGLSPEIEFGLALATAGRGDLAKARLLMEKLAPADQTGFEGAHLWLAKDLLELEGAFYLGGQKTAEQHLLRAAESARPDVAGQAQEKLVALYFSQGRSDEALDLMTAASKQSPDWALAASRAYKLRGDESSAVAAAEKAGAQISQIVIREPENAEARLKWADVQVLLGRYAEAEKILLDGLGRPHDDQLREALLTLYLGWHDGLRSSPHPTGSQRLSLLKRALQHAPEDVRVWQRLAGLCGGQDPVAPQARALLDEARQEEKAPAEALVVLGAMAFQEGDVGTAQRILEEAVQLAPSDPAAMNNLAWVLAHADPPQLERALPLANEAVEAKPENPRYRDTRGRILAKLDRPQEALADLELALQSLSADAELHRILAGVYEQLGEKSLAAEHRRLADPAQNGGP